MPFWTFWIITSPVLQMSRAKFTSSTSFFYRAKKWYAFLHYCTWPYSYWFVLRKQWHSKSSRNAIIGQLRSLDVLHCNTFNFFINVDKLKFSPLKQLYRRSASLTSFIKYQKLYFTFQVRPKFSFQHSYVYCILFSHFST